MQESRGPLLPGLQPLAFLDVRGQTQGGGTSLANKTEAACVVSALCQILQAGIEAGNVGVICLYRAQVRCLPRAEQASKWHCKMVLQCQCSWLTACPLMTSIHEA